MTARFSIRPMEAGDLDAVTAAEKRCFSLPWSRESVEYALYAPCSLSFTAVDEAGTLLGYCMGRCIFEDLEIMNIAVEAPYRRMGIGRALLALLLQSAAKEDCERALLEVRESNTVARNLYESFGFVTCGRRKNYYFNPREDALVMQSDISSFLKSF